MPIDSAKLNCQLHALDPHTALSGDILVNNSLATQVIKCTCTVFINNFRNISADSLI